MSPFISTAFIQHVDRAYLYFAVTMSLGLITAALVVVLLKFRTMAQLIGTNTAETNTETKDPVVELGIVNQDTTDTKPIDEHIAADSTGRDTAEKGDLSIGEQAGPETPVEAQASPDSSGAKLVRIFKTPMVYPMLAYSFLYVSPSVPVSIC
jgi:hypothetical protein